VATKVHPDQRHRSSSFISASSKADVKRESAEVCKKGLAILPVTDKVSERDSGSTVLLNLKEGDAAVQDRHESISVQIEAVEQSFVRLNDDRLESENFLRHFSSDGCQDNGRSSAFKEPALRIIEDVLLPRRWYLLRLSVHCRVPSSLGGMMSASYAFIELDTDGLTTTTSIEVEPLDLETLVCDLRLWSPDDNDKLVLVGISCHELSLVIFLCDEGQATAIEELEGAAIVMIFVLFCVCREGSLVSPVLFTT
jgi:hypothetical protein